MQYMLLLDYHWSATVLSLFALDIILILLLTINKDDLIAYQNPKDNDQILPNLLESTVL